jgi:hypothetical protein
MCRRFRRPPPSNLSPARVEPRDPLGPAVRFEAGVFPSRKEGSGLRCPAQDAGMDSNGARALARKLEARNGELPQDVPLVALQASGAAPIFHWMGVEPPARHRVDDEPEVPARSSVFKRRRRR